MVSRERVDAVEDHPPSNPVVPMPPGKIVVRAVRIQNDDEVRSPSTNPTSDIAPNIARIFQLPILVTEERDGSHPEHLRGPSLFLCANRCELLRRDAPTTRSLVAIGQDHIGDLPTLLGQPGHGAASQEIRIVGMRGDEHHTPFGCRHESSLAMVAGDMVLA
jgi:hypothetical protein